MPCGKCLECRLEYARQWAIRCVHEAKMHDSNTFITLTYSNENLKSDRLQYSDFQGFVKRLRNHIRQETLNVLYAGYSQETQRQKFKQLKKESPENYKKIIEKERISIFVTGEYGETKKRPHWHAIIFNWEPKDKVYRRQNENGDKIYKSQTLDTLWGKNNPKESPSELGDVTFNSAGYVANLSLIHI